MSFWDTIAGKGIGDVGNFFGMSTGASQFQTDPTKFQLPNFQNTQDYTGFQAQHAIGQQAPQLNNIPQQQFRGQQSMLGNLLMSAAQGRGPSAAQAQLQQATDANIRNAMAMGQSMPGQSNMAAYRNILENQANAQQQAAGQSAILKAQEQQAAQSGLGNLLQSARQQDLGLAGQNAQLAQNQFGMDQNAAQGWYGMGQKANEEQLQANIAQQQIQSGAYGNAQNAATSTMGGLLKGVGSGLAGMAHGGVVPGYASGGGVTPGGLGFFGLGLPSTQVGIQPIDFGGGKKRPTDNGPGQPVLSGDMPDTLGENAPSSMETSQIPLPNMAKGGVAHYHEGFTHGVLALLGGGGVPGRAKTKGDSKSNDTVPAMLSPGEIVLPRSVTQDEDAAEKARLFVEAIRKRKAV